MDMKKYTIIVLIIFVGCAKKQSDSNLIFINSLQTNSFIQLNSEFSERLNVEGDILKITSGLDSIVHKLDEMRMEMIVLSGGFKDMRATYLVNPNDVTSVEKYFYGTNNKRYNELNKYLSLIEEWEHLYDNSNFESRTMMNYEKLNESANAELVSVSKKDIFKNKTVSEALVILFTVQRQIQIDKYNLYLNYKTRDNNEDK